jgi:two-component system chemotaxis response regulator CheB
VPPRPAIAPVRSRAAGRKLVLIASSTGGPKALGELIPKLPAPLGSGSLIVQHMPAGFTRSLAERLDRLSPLAVKEAEHGDVAAAGQVLIAPGGKHLAVNARGSVELTEAPPEHGVRPAVDVLFRSLPGHFGGRIVAAVLTGMGSDGAEGASLIRAVGGRVVAEDASTSVVYGMPRAVAERGAAERQLPLGEIAGCVTDLVLRLPRGAAERRAG